MERKIDYSKVCFVIMPFGTKKVTIPKIKNILGVTITKEKTKEVDFDYIYREIFMPAISAVNLPEGGNLIARRADNEFYSGSISNTMFEFIEYSRMALADITGLNANVFYELGARHNSNSNGTAIFRLSDSIIPFDIEQMRAFPYKYNPFEEVDKSKKLITEVLENSLVHNVIDSPIYLALQKQQKNVDIQSLLIEAENALRNNDVRKVLQVYENIISIDPNNAVIRMKMGSVYKNMGEWENALFEFKFVTKILETHYEAYRERGIAENKLYEKDTQKYPIDGTYSLEKAISLNNKDYDSYCGLGGILKRKGKLNDSLTMYNKAMKLSLGNPYPLLNYVKLKCKIEKNFNISDDLKMMINLSKEYLENQVMGEIPYNAPWSFFDLSEIYSILGENTDKVMETVKKGIYYCTDWWQVNTFKDSLMLLKDINNIPNNYKIIMEFVCEFIEQKGNNE